MPRLQMFAVAKLVFCMTNYYKCGSTRKNLLFFSSFQDQNSGHGLAWGSGLHRAEAGCWLGCIPF